MMNVDINGDECRVLENLGYQHSIGKFACWVRDVNTGVEFMAVREGARWRRWGPKDRVCLTEFRNAAKGFSGNSPRARRHQK